MSATVAWQLKRISAYTSIIRTIDPNIFVRLTRLDKTTVQGEKRRDTRRRIDIEDFGGDPTVIKRLVLQLADAKVRLVVTSLDETTKRQQVEVAHEALIRHWTRLGKWLDENRIILQLIERLNQEAKDWSDAARKDEFLLLQGGRLDEAAKLKNQTKFTLNQLEQDYIDACVALQERERIETQRQRDEAIRGQITALAALSKSSFAANEQLEALVAAVKAATQLKREPQLQKELGVQVTEALQQAVYGIQERNRLEGNTDPVYGVAFSPDSTLIATANGDKTVKLWQANGLLLRVLLDHTNEVNAVVFSHDSKMIASGGKDRTVKIWRVKDGALLQTFLGHDAEVTSVSFSFDDKVLASTSEDRTVRLWSVNSGVLIKTLPSNNGGTRAVSFSPDGSLIASGGWDTPPWQGRIRLWSNETSIDSSGVNAFDVDTGVMRSIDFSKDGKTVICCGDSGTVKLLQVSDGEILVDIKAHDNWVMGAKISPDGQTFASVSTDKTVKLWSIDGRLIKTLDGHNDAVYNLAFSPDGETLATASADRTVRLWNVQGPSLGSLDGVQGSVHFGVCFSPDGKLLASASYDATQRGWTVKLWNSNGGFVRTLVRHYESIRTVRFSPDSQLVASASWDGTVKVCRIDGELVTNFTEHGQPIPNVVSYDDRPAVNGVGFSSDGKILASVGYDRHIRIWDLAGTQQKVIPNPHPDQSYRIEFSPDGKTFATASWDRTVKVWSIEGELLQTLTGHSNWLYGLSFSRDGKLLASAGLDRVIRIWSTEGKLIQTLEGHRDGIYDLCFGPNSQVIASASLDGTIRLWDITGALLKTITGHTNGVYGVSFSPDGKTIASASWDGSIKLWSAETESFEELLQCGCRWLSDYLKTNPNVSEADRHICCNGGNFGTTVLST